MQIVIDVPEEIYNSACSSNNIWDMRMAGFVCSAIANGTPLPKGHGRLGDLDILLNKAIRHRECYMEVELGDSSYCRGKLHAYELYAEEVENAKTIIEADKTESEE